jgi:CBS domain-containing protein
MVQDLKEDVQKVSELPVTDFMTRKVIKVRQGDSIRSVIETFKAHNISGAPVVNNDDKLIGLITEYDLLLQAATQDLRTPIHFNSNVFSVPNVATLREVLLVFHKNRYKRVPVIDQNKGLVGIISRIDLLCFLDEMEKKQGQGRPEKAKPEEDPKSNSDNSEE